MSGQRIDSRYQVLEKLGAGGMGVVYKAYDALTQTEVALKSITINRQPMGMMSPPTLDDKTRAMMADEFRIAAGLYHPHILRTLDYGFDAHGIPYFTMPLLQGGAPITIAAQNASTEQKLRMLRQVLYALVYLHRHRVIHRDIKPPNVWVEANGTVKVLDFGIAIRERDLSGEHVAGTLYYMAPEIFLSGSPSASSDLYSVGVMAYEMFSGRLPFEGSVTEVMQNIVSDPPPLHYLNADDALKAWIGVLLAKRPQHRPANAIEALKTLIGLSSTQSSSLESEDIRESFLQHAPFIGRHREMQNIVTALDQLSGGTGSSLLISGESGVGKSRLIEEARVQALIKGAFVLHGQGAEGGGLRYQLWRDVLPRLSLSTPLNDLEAGIVLDVVPSIAALIGRAVQPAPVLVGAGQHSRLIETIVEIFRRQTRPIALFLEDLHWASESLDVLDALIPLTHERPLFIIGSYRADDRPDLPQRLPDMQPLTLAPLSTLEMRDLCSAVLGEVKAYNPIVQRLEKETEGNAFFAVEFIRALAEDAGSLSRVIQTPLPEQLHAVGVDRLLERRIGRLPNWGLKLLQLVAVAGRRLDIKVLETGLDAQPDILTSQTIESWLKACSAAQILAVSGDEWQFSHDKLRAYVLDHTPAEDLPVLHRITAEAIEAVYPDDKSRADLLMTHWKIAGNADKEVHYAGLVIEFLMWTKGDYAQARTMTEELLVRLPESDVRRVNFLNHLSEVGWRTGQYDLTVTYAQQAIELGLRHEAYSLIGRSYGNLGIAERMKGNAQASEDYLQESLRMRELAQDEIGIARSLSSLGALYFQMGQNDVAEDYYKRAMVIQEKLADKQGYALNLNNLAQLSSLRGDNISAKQYVQSALEISQSIGHRYAVAVAQSTLGIMHSMDREYVEARVQLQAALENFMAIRDRYGTAYVLGGLASALSPDDPNLKKVIVRGLNLAKELKAPHLIMSSFIGTPRVYYTAGQRAYALTLMAAIKQHPSNKDGDNPQWRTLFKEFDFPTEEIEAIEGMVVDRPFEELVEEVLRDWA